MNIGTKPRIIPTRACTFLILWIACTAIAGAGAYSASSSLCTQTTLYPGNEGPGNFAYAVHATPSGSIYVASITGIWRLQTSGGGGSPQLLLNRDACNDISNLAHDGARVYASCGLDTMPGPDDVAIYTIDDSTLQTAPFLNQTQCSGPTSLAVDPESHSLYTGCYAFGDDWSSLAQVTAPFTERLIMPGYTFSPQEFELTFHSPTGNLYFVNSQDFDNTGGVGVVYPNGTVSMLLSWDICSMPSALVSDSAMQPTLYVSCENLSSTASVISFDTASGQVNDVLNNATCFNPTTLVLDESRGMLFAACMIRNSHIVSNALVNVNLLTKSVSVLANSTECSLDSDTSQSITLLDDGSIVAACGLEGGVIQIQCSDNNAITSSLILQRT